MKELSDNERDDVRKELTNLADVLEEEWSDCQPHMLHSKAYLQTRLQRVRYLAALFALLLLGGV